MQRHALGKGCETYKESDRLPRGWRGTGLCRRCRHDQRAGSRGVDGKRGRRERVRHSTVSVERGER